MKTLLTLYPEQFQQWCVCHIIHVNIQRTLKDIHNTDQSQW